MNEPSSCWWFLHVKLNTFNSFKNSERIWSVCWIRFKAFHNNFLETFWAFGLKLAQLKVADSIDQLEHSSRKHWSYVKNLIEGATKGPHIDLDVVDARFAWNGLEFSRHQKVLLFINSGAMYWMVPAWVENCIAESFVSIETPKSPILARRPLWTKKMFSG